MLISVLGRQGSGKNTFLSWIASKSNRTNKRQIWSNFFLDLDTYNELEIIDLLYLDKNVIVFIDEAYTWLESRTSSSNVNKFISHIIFQARKRMIDIYISAQMYSSVDLRFRDQADLIVECLSRNEYDDFTYRIHLKNSNKTNCYTLPFIKAKEKYFPLFDTYEIINSHNIHNLEFQLLKSYPEKLSKKVNEIAEYIKPEFEFIKITHNSLKRVLINESIVLGFEPFVYPILKGIFNENE